MRDFTVFDEQICLYAKGWYKKTDTMEDLRILQAKVAGMQPHHVNDVDVINLVSGCLHKVLDREQTDYDLNILYLDVWRENRPGYDLFCTKTVLTIKDIVESHLRVIRCKACVFIPKLPAPSADYLPLESEDTLIRWKEINS